MKKISYSYDTTSAIDQQMCRALSDLETSLIHAVTASDALLEARPSQSSVHINDLINQFEATVKGLRTEAEALERLSSGLKSVIEHFEDAESTIVHTIADVDIVPSRDQSAFYGKTPDAVGASPQLPRAIVLPNSYGKRRPALEWLDQILEDETQFVTWR